MGERESGAVEGWGCVMWVILAWVEAHKEPVEGTGRPDLGVPPEWRDVVVPRAVTWVIDGDDSDIERATAYGNSQVPRARVFTYSRWETDPLARARADVMGSRQS